MNERNGDNLRELFKKLGDPEQAQRAVEDVQKGEQIIHEYPAPEPNEAVIAGIKAKIAETVHRRKSISFKWAVYKTAAVAAVFIVLATISVKLFERSNDKPERVITASVIPDTIWESSDIAADDADLAVLTAEIKQIESEVLALQLGETNGNGQETIVELETELIEIVSTFWKG